MSSPQEMLINLCNAIKKKDIATILSMLTKNPEISMNHCDLPKGMLSPMWEAMTLGHIEILEILIDFGANVNERFLSEKNEIYGFSFLHRLAFLSYNWQSSKSVAEILIERGADVNALYHPVFMTPLQIAIEHGNLTYTEFFCSITELNFTLGLEHQSTIQ